MALDTMDLTLLLDYYGELLPEKQRMYCDLFCNQDYSLAEIALETGISRQGVHDALNHAEASLKEFERILGCAGRDAKVRSAVAQAQEAVLPLLQCSDSMAIQAGEKLTTILQSIREMIDT